MHFNSQPHEEADAATKEHDKSPLVFQLTASRGGWPWKASMTCNLSNFNSQPHEEADKVWINSIFFLFYFNSQPHEEADRYLLVCYVTTYISTHSLTRRLTMIQWNTTLLEVFQLTASRGGWQATQGFREQVFCISTHSLTRRLTSCHFVIRNCECNFNSQPHEEADQNILWCMMIESISTHSLTRRLTDAQKEAYKRYNISTHSLTRRLTMIQKIHSESMIFQLTASRGGWQQF